MKTASFIVISELFTTLLAGSLISSAAFAGPSLKAPDFTIQFSHGKLVATAPEHYHFNLQAPMSLTIPHAASLKPTSSTESKVTFDVTDAVPTPAAATYHLSIYMCDDAKTFCEKHEVDYSPASQSTSAASALSGAAASTTAASDSSAPKKIKLEHGFIMNNPDRALVLAKKTGKPLMLEFYGIWCPPCNELDEKVYSTKKFLKSASRFVALKLDADSPVSWKLKSQYQVSGYPTIVLASSDGDEITRIVGYRDLPDFLATLDTAWKNRDASLVKLEAKAAHGDRAAADKAGLIHLDRGEAKAAATLLQGTTAKKEYLALAEIQALDDDHASDDKKIARLNQAIQEFPKTPNTLDWLEALSRIYDGQKKDDLRRASLTRAIDLAIEMSKKPELLKGYDATPADLLESEADYRETLDGNEKAKQDWLNAAQAYADRGVSDTERANNLERAFCLAKGGKFDESREIYRKLQKAYPNEFTFYFAQARMEFETAKQTGAAIDLANTALLHSYGDNRLRVALLLAQAYDARGERDKSKSTIDEAVKNATVPSDPKVRSNRYLAQLKKFRDTLN